MLTRVGPGTDRLSAPGSADTDVRTAQNRRFRGPNVNPNVDFSRPTRSSCLESSIHPPKLETFDLVAHTNTDPKGIVRTVDVYRVQPWGLYLARPTPGRAQFHYLQSWLLPALGLRATIFHFNPGHERDQDFYLDVGEYTPGPDRWRSVDHYLDLVVRTGRDTVLTDVDELLDAHHAGLVSTAVAELAFQRAAAAVAGLASHGHDLSRWLASAGMPVTWADRGRLSGSEPGSR